MTDNPTQLPPEPTQPTTETSTEAHTAPANTDPPDTPDGPATPDTTPASATTPPPALDKILPETALNVLTQLTTQLKTIAANLATTIDILEHHTDPANNPLIALPDRAAMTCGIATFYEPLATRVTCDRRIGHRTNHRNTTVRHYWHTAQAIQSTVHPNTSCLHPHPITEDRSHLDRNGNHMYCLQPHPHTGDHAHSYKNPPPFTAARWTNNTRKKK